MNCSREYLSSRIIASGKDLNHYSKLYFKTNEDLVTPFRKIDLMDKDVLSVLASSDHVFTARYYGAKKVDSFDKNKLSLYYYYMRVWTIEYNREIYPEELLQNDYKWLGRLLKSVSPRDEVEEEALSFWKSHLNDETVLSNLFFDDPTEGKILFKSSHSIGSVVREPMNFSTMDITQKIDSSDTYDVVLLSNIIEWARGDSNKIIGIRDNLLSLLNKEGIVLCSSLVHRSDESIQLERRIFDSNFEFKDFDDGNYCYQKRYL